MIIAKPAVKKYNLFMISGVVWTAMGLVLNYLAFHWYYKYETVEIFTIVVGGILASAIITVFGFSKIVKKNITRIQSYPDKVCLFAFQEWKSYFMVMVMMVMGIVLRKTALIPKLYLSPLYIAIGLSLFLSSLFYYRSFYLEKYK